MPFAKKPSYRLISHAVNDAATNMAIDEAVLEAHLHCLVPPTLRLYNFSPPAVSIGYAQSISKEVKEKIQSAGFDIVRRPTGGRAVLHFGDLTYSFICSSNGTPIAEYNLVSQSIASAYKQICQGLILFLDYFGIEASLGHGRNNYRDKYDCFLATTIGDLQYKGNKIVGSAQLRRKHAVLQHGSIILNQPQHLRRELINDSDSETVNIQHANFYEITKYEHSIISLENEMVRAFEQTFTCRFLPKELTTYEYALVKKLTKKYQNMVEKVIN